VWFHAAKPKRWWERTNKLEWNELLRICFAQKAVKLCNRRSACRQCTKNRKETQPIQINKFNEMSLAIYYITTFRFTQIHSSYRLISPLVSRSALLLPSIAPFPLPRCHQVASDTAPQLCSKYVSCRQRSGGGLLPRRPPPRQ